jgi:glutamine cyclotransferase
MADVGRLLPVLPVLCVSVILTACSPNPVPVTGSGRALPGEAESAFYYGYEVVNAYPHDRTAFTQGLAYQDGILYEGTGLRGSSSLRRVDLETGAVRDSVALEHSYFGEGITLYDDRIVQLTWKSRVGFVYDRDSLALVDEFSYDTEGWGITNDGEYLIMSDGTSRLYFLDQETFTTGSWVEVADGGTAVERLNELEFINSLVYANVWKTDLIAIIDPADGRVTGWADLSGLLKTRPVSGPVDVLNGIAWDSVNERLFVTGKLWPWLFEIRLVPKGTTS